ncbi:MAG TPA: ABC transporter permease [Vicinamibacterales bacterium]|nr:ABC transporter permease [Vicinamibacterales bacterium]
MTRREEIEQHLADRYDELRAQGMSDADAARAIESERLELEGDRGAGLLADASGDVKYAWRTLRKNIGVSAVIVLTLALGIGANAAIFSVINAVLLNPLPFREPSQLIRIFHTYSKLPEGIESLSPADFYFLRERSRALESIAMYIAPNEGFAFVDGDRAMQVYGAWTSADIFKVLGVKPLLGDTFAAGDDAPTAPRKAVISYAFWRRVYDGNPNVIGRQVRIAGQSMPIAGVMPAGFWYPRGDRADVWVTRAVAMPTRQGPWGLSTLARVRKGVTPADLGADLDAAAQAVQKRFPGPGERWTLVTRPLKEQAVRDIRPVLLLLFGAVAIVLVIACVNVANVMLARATAREREIAVRTALGASRARIVRQLLTESVVLAAIGAMAGLAIARVLVKTVLAMAPQNFQMLRDVEAPIDGRVLLATVAVAIVSAAICGVVPALVSLRSSLSATMGDGRSGMDVPRRRRLRSALVVAEFALSLLLLVVAGLVTRSLLRIESVDAGFRSDHLLTLTISLPSNTYDTPQKITAFYNRLLDAIRRMPAVESAALADGLPAGFATGGTNFHVDGHPMANGEAEPIAESPFVSGAYFRTLGIPIVAGRTFDERDADPKANNVVMINRTLARRFFGDVDPVGRKLMVSGNQDSTIVGVVGDVKYSPLDSADPEITIYTPFEQIPFRVMIVAIRTVGDPLDLVASVRNEVIRLDPEVPLGRTRTMEQLMSDSVERPRFRTALLVMFAVVALVLAAVGIYGVMAYSVSQRTREMGVRLALGAQPVDVTRLVVGEGLRLAIAGVACGVAGALALTRVLSTLVFAISPLDPLTFGSVTLLLVAIALAACLIPAYRATRADPLAALRAE